MSSSQSRNQKGANVNSQRQMQMTQNLMQMMQNQMQMTQNPMPMAQNQMPMAQNQMQMAQNPTMGQESSNLLNIMSQLKALQGQTNVKGKQVTRTQMPSGDLGLAGLLSSMNNSGMKNPEIMTHGRCVWVTGIPEDYHDADILFNIFGNFGNVLRIKFTEKKPDGALIEMDDPRAAWKARKVMDDVKLNGKKLSVNHCSIEGAFIKEWDLKSKDFRKAKGTWRFSKDGKFRKVCMSRLRYLTPKIIVTNLPEGKSDDLKAHIIEAGFTVKSIEGSKRTEEKEDKKDSKPGFTVLFVELASVEEAVGAIAKLHNSWSKKFGEQVKDKWDQGRNLNFTFAGNIREKKNA